MPEDQKLPNLKTSDFQDTLEGQLPGNVAAEYGNEAGAAGDSLTEGQTPDEVEQPDPAELAEERAAIQQKNDQEAAAILKRQVSEYAADADGNEQA